MRRFGMIAVLVAGVGLGLTGCIVTRTPAMTASAHPEGLEGRYNQVDDPGDDLVFSAATDPVSGIAGYRVDTVPTGTDTVKETQWLTLDDQTKGGRTLVQFRIGDDETGYAYLAMQRPDGDTLLFSFLGADGLTDEARDLLRSHKVTLSSDDDSGSGSIAYLQGTPGELRAALRDLMGVIKTPDPMHLVRVGSVD